ncbi:MAG: dihydrodipicolinate reductase [Myxococcota bacterium]|nr:dihydrodipicolinate reductase [Myxococcota bacterium]
MIRRVVVWGPGNVGRPAIRGVIRNPELELVGVIAHSSEKEGADSGELAGVERVGVPAVLDPTILGSLRPDALVYAVNSDFRPEESIAECCAALRAGINVVAVGLYGLMHPPSADPALRERFEEACRRGGSSFFTSGIDPGFAMDLIPLVLSGVCQEIREIRIREIFNYAHYDQPEAVKTLVGMGMPMDQTPPMLHPFALESVWGGILRELGESLDTPVDEIRTVVEKHALETRVENSMGVFEAGHLGAFRFEVQAWLGGQPRLIVEHVTRISDDTAPQWPKPAGQGCHQVIITGHPDITLTFEAEDSEGNHAGGGNAAAAGRIVNAIPQVCQAKPGLLTSRDLGPIVGRGLIA